MAVKITKHQFNELVTSLSVYFEHKTPSIGAIDAWYEKVQWVNTGSMPFIYKRMTDDEYWPKNFAGKVQEYYYIWKKSQQQEKKEYPSCQDCLNGLLPMTKNAEGFDYKLTFAFRCGRCKVRETEIQIPMETLDVLLSKGYTEDWPLTMDKVERKRLNDNKDIPFTEDMLNRLTGEIMQPPLFEDTEIPF
jgi:hypothetical protein